MRTPTTRSPKAGACERGQDSDALLFYGGDAGASWEPVALPSGL